MADRRHPYDHDGPCEYKLHIHHHFYHCRSMADDWVPTGPTEMGLDKAEPSGPMVEPRLVATQFPQPPACPEGELHVVSPGETLSGLARRFNVPLAAIIAANPQIPNPDLIFPGQTVCIPIPGDLPPVIPPPPQTCAGLFYTVQRGDTLFAISRRFSTTVNAILAANPQIVNPNIIFAGQVICVPALPAEEGARPTAPPDGEES